MKFYKIIFPIIAVSAIVMSSCADQNSLGYSVNEPDSLVALEYLKAYKPLKNYVDTVANPSFKLGVGVSASDFNSKDVLYRLNCSNFNNVTTANNEMKEGSVVQSDGSLDTTDVIAFLKNAKQAGISVFGHDLIGYSGQNAKYLNTIIAPDTVSTGLPGSGWYSFKATNTISGNPWDERCIYSFPSAPSITSRVPYELDFMVKGSVNGTMTASTFYSWTMKDFPSATISTDWKEVSLVVDSIPQVSSIQSLVFSLGAYVGTVYIDKMALYKLDTNGNKVGDNLVPNGDFETAASIKCWSVWSWCDSGLSYYGISARGEGYNPGIELVDKSAETQSTILTTQMQNYINGMMTACNPYVHAWDVVSDPMSDTNPTQLKTGVGQTLTSDEFFWQDYLGKDYAVKAFSFARKYGNSDDKLFINEYGLESTNQAKLNGLLSYISYVESQGAKIDGIGTQMHVSVNTADSTAIIAMFQKLAATGKLIKISELDMGIADGVTNSNVIDAQLQAQSKLYNFIVRSYFKYIPAAQRYGITIWSPLDSSTSSSWRAGQPIGLWTQQYDRKRSYGGVADGLAGKY